MVKMGIETMTTACGSIQDNWAWDTINKSPDVVLSQDSHAAYFHIDPLKGSSGTAAVRGNKGFLDGIHYWEIHLLEPAWGTSVMFGIGTKQATLHVPDDRFVNLLGMDRHSWGLSYKGTTWHNGQCEQYTAMFNEASTIVGMLLNLYDGTLTYYKNGTCLGVAFRGLNEVGEPLYPVISSTAEDTEMEVRVQTCRYLSLEDKCKLVIARRLKQNTQVSCLPLPGIFQKQISDMVY